MTPELTPEEALVLEYRTTGAHETINAVVEGRWPWIRRTANRYGRRGPVDRDDLLTPAALGVLDAAERWDPKRGPFRALCWWCARSRCTHAIRVARMGFARLPTMSMDKPVVEAGRELHELLEDPTTEDPATVLDLERVCPHLPAEDVLLLVRRFRQGWTLQECADRMGVTREGARQRELRALRRAEAITAGHVPGKG